jgi:hypothetical protein
MKALRSSIEQAGDRLLGFVLPKLEAGACDPLFGVQCACCTCCGCGCGCGGFARFHYNCDGLCVQAYGDCCSGYQPPCG